MLFPDALTLAASAAINASVALLWLASRSTGLPLGPHALQPQAVGVWDSLCSALEVALAVGCLRLLTSRHSVAVFAAD